MAHPRIAPPTTWGRSTVATACPLDCPDSCSLAVTVERGRVVKIDGSTAAPTTAGVICDKIRRFDRRVYSGERILYPAVSTGAKGRAAFERVTWDEALDLIAERLEEARARWGAEAVLPYADGGSNGALTQDLEDARFFRRFGASRLTRAISGTATDRAAGAMYGAMPGVAGRDYEDARLIVIWGFNPSAPGFHLMAPITRAQQLGAKIVVIDPRRTAVAGSADLHLPVRPGTDLPVALAVIRTLFAEGWADEAFLAAHADGVDALRAAAEPWTIERAAAEAGLDPAALRTFAEWYGTTSPAVIRCGRGQEHTRHGDAASMAILSLAAIGGKFGVRGGGYTANNAPAWGLSAESFIDTPPADTRAINMHQLGRALTSLDAPPISVLFVYNGNPLSTEPDRNRLREGLAREDLFTVVHDQVMTDTAHFADLVLPATTFLEHYDVAAGTGAYHLHLVQPAIAAVGESRPNQELFRSLGARLGLTTDDDDLGLGETGALLEMAARLPDATRAAVLEGAPPPAPGDGRPIQFVDVQPATPNGRIQLSPASMGPTADVYAYSTPPASTRHPLRLITVASRHTVSSILGECRPSIVRVTIHPDDAHPRSIAEGDSVRISNDLGAVECEAMVTPEIRPGTVSLPKGLWSRNTFNGSTPLALIPDAVTAIGGSACLNDAWVEIELLGRH
jgi:anaerobic selenocysteine-containing dehydrogenase